MAGVLPSGSLDVGTRGEHYEDVIDRRDRADLRELQDLLTHVSKGHRKWGGLRPWADGKGEKPEIFWLCKEHYDKVEPGLPVT